MSVPYYVGRQAIAYRLGLRSPRVVTKLAIQNALPIYPRRERNVSGKGWHISYAISESAICAWELAKGRAFVNELRARAEAHQRGAATALANQKTFSLRANVG